MFKFDKNILEKCHKKNVFETKKTKRRKLPHSGLTYTTGDPDYNIAQFNAHIGSGITSGEFTDIAEAKKSKKRYYLKPQNIFVDTKTNLLKALIDLDNKNATIYTLNNLENNSDIEKLSQKDIIYKYKDGILFDKNDVKIWDYDLTIRKEEKRPKLGKKPDFSEESIAKLYSDRLTDADLKEDLNTDFLSIDGQRDPYTRLLWELFHTDKKTGKKVNTPSDADCYIDPLYMYNKEHDASIFLMSNKEAETYGFDGVAVITKIPEELFGAELVADELGLDSYEGTADRVNQVGHKQPALFIDIESVDEIKAEPNYYAYTKYYKNKYKKGHKKLETDLEDISETLNTKLAESDNKRNSKKLEVKVKEAANKEPKVDTLNLDPDEEIFKQDFDSINAYGEKINDKDLLVDTCCICGEDIDGYGNNPEPYMSSDKGRCCDQCNSKFVIPARISQFYKYKNNK